MKWEILDTAIVAALTDQGRRHGQQDEENQYTTIGGKHSPSVSLVLRVSNNSIL